MFTIIQTIDILAVKNGNRNSQKSNGEYGLWAKKENKKKKKTQYVEYDNTPTNTILIKVLDIFISLILHNFYI